MAHGGGRGRGEHIKTFVYVYLQTQPYLGHHSEVCYEVYLNISSLAHVDNL